MHNLQPVEEISPLFAALGDATRLRLVHKLGEDSPQSIAQLADGLGLTHQGVTKHLRVLEGAGLVSGRKVGRERQFSPQARRVREAQQYLTLVAQQWDDALSRLQQFVDEPD